MNILYVILIVGAYIFKMYSDAKKNEELERKKRMRNSIPSTQSQTNNKPSVQTQKLPPVAVEDPIEKMIRELKEAYTEERLPNEEVKEEEFDAPVYENLDERYQNLKLDNLPTQEGGSIYDDKDWVNEPMHKKILISSKTQVKQKN